MPGNSDTVAQLGCVDSWSGFLRNHWCFGPSVASRFEWLSQEKRLIVATVIAPFGCSARQRHVSVAKRGENIKMILRRKNVILSAGMDIINHIY